jgi:formylglycine-generating enzyme required for sulfatase activity
VNEMRRSWKLLGGGFAVAWVGCVELNTVPRIDGGGGGATDVQAVDTGSTLDNGTVQLTDRGMATEDAGSMTVDSGTVTDRGMQVMDVGPRCSAGQTSCAGVCRAVATDRANCGACANACPASTNCVGGACISSGGCPAGMIMVPAGTYLMGSAMYMGRVYDERPVHSVELSAFCMDITEVTVASFSACVSAGSCSGTTGMGCNWMEPGREMHPINCVTWSDADAFCRWRGGSLPTEAQWEYVAKGTEGRMFPWGDAVPTTQLCWGRGNLGISCPVQAVSGDVTALGLWDLGGNVAEWTADWYAMTYPADTGTPLLNPSGPATGTTRVSRGGDFAASNAIDVRSTNRVYRDPTRYLRNLGFRCVR